MGKKESFSDMEDELNILIQFIADREDLIFKLSLNPSKTNLDKIQNIKGRFNEAMDDLVSRMMSFLGGLSLPELKHEFQTMDEVILKFISSRVAERFEMYEVCHAIKEVLEERELER
ncbi:MAG: hypothetical protein ABIR66_08375 [Saprospiraceae bacterium]